MARIIHNRGWWSRPVDFEIGHPDTLEHLVFREPDGSASFLSFSIPGVTGRECFAFSDAWVDPDGRCYVCGMRIDNLRDENEFLAGKRTEFFEVQPCYLASLLVRVPPSLLRKYALRILDDASSTWRQDVPCRLELATRRPGYEKVI